METFVGNWKLCSWSAVWAVELLEVESEGCTDKFLFQDPADPPAPPTRPEDAGEVHGSTLSIGADGRFSQSGECDGIVLTYDEDGIQELGVCEFSGVLWQDSGRGYLQTGAGTGRLRVEDGDTRICDSARVVGEQLVRAIYVLTDELYGDRVVLVYDRA